LTAALLLTEYSHKVYIIYRKAEFTKAEPAWVQQVLNNKIIEIIFSAEVVKINGAKTVESIDLNTGQNIPVNGIFIEIGSEPKMEFGQLALKHEGGYVIVDEHQETNIKGFYAAGDVVKSDLKQIIVAAGQGAIAAFNAYKSIRQSKALPVNGNQYS
jgi:thioredoxin reductase (NADPH)